jgi:hypothetical protein
MVKNQKWQWSEIVDSISQKEFDVESYCQQILEDANLRDLLVIQMCEHPDIMVYYHCFYVIEKASQQKAELFYPYFAQFSELLKHPNSYHRDFGLILVGNLARVDVDKKVEAILPAYLTHACDPKFMTARCCLNNCQKIFKALPELQEKIISSLLALEKLNSYTEDQRALLKFDMLGIIQFLSTKEITGSIYHDYIADAMKSSSPKTRKKAQELAERFD